MYYIPDALDHFARHDAEQQQMLDRLPKCTICEEHIQEDHCYQINDEVICVHCLNEYFRKDVEDLME